MRKLILLGLVLLLVALPVWYAVTRASKPATSRSGVAVGVVGVDELQVLKYYDDSCHCWLPPGPGFSGPVPLHGPAANVRVNGSY